MIPLWATHGRDFEALYPIAWYLREKKKLRVAFCPLFDTWWLDILHPRAVVTGGSIGAPECLHFVKASVNRGIPTLTLFAEGNMKRDSVEQMTWGWNKEKHLYEDITLLWSVRVRNLILEKYPHLAPRLIVAGASGFDRYKIYRFLSKQELLDKYNLKYSLIVGYATWAFDRLEDQKFIKNIRRIFGDEGTEQLRRDRESVRVILTDVIRNNPDILFLLKLHPGTILENHESRGLEQYPNTLLLKNEEPIADIISASDLWMVYDSTTCLEAWLLGKTTLHINPSGPTFPRDEIYKGSLIVQTSLALQDVLNEIHSGRIPAAFADISDIRKKLIRDIIQWDDGLNHVRSARALLDLLSRGETGRKPSLFDRATSFASYLWIRLARRFPHIYPISWKAHVHRLFQVRQLAAYEKRYAPQLENFHKTHFLEGETSEQDDE